MNVARAELGLVLLDMVQSLHVAVSHRAVISLRALTFLLQLAKVSVVSVVDATAVNARVEELALFVFVDAPDVAFDSFELVQEKMLDDIGTMAAEHKE